MNPLKTTRSLSCPSQVKLLTKTPKLFVVINVNWTPCPTLYVNIFYSFADNRKILHAQITVNKTNCTF